MAEADAPAFVSTEVDEHPAARPAYRAAGRGAQILLDLGVTSLRLMTNNPAKYAGLRSYGLTIAERVPIEVAATEHSERYLTAKRVRLGHLLGEDPPSHVGEVG